MSATQHLVVAVHGILTGQVDVSWVDQLEAFLSCKTLKKEYVAGPFPLWNVLVKNRLLARALANEVLLHADRGVSRYPRRISFVAHSNGCDIVLRCIKRLAERGVATHGMILMGSVTEPDIDRSGVAELLKAGWLQRAIAYSSAGDRVLKLKSKWPYKNLGRTGWMANQLTLGSQEEAMLSLQFNAELRTRRFDWGHSGYFTAGNRDGVFAQIAEDLLAPFSTERIGTQRREEAKALSGEEQHT